ncbi:NUDIX hydrolase [Bacteroidales bacterium OttesenSCG-928-A17]|nr:NUDIX hydrolase [Bacteroidales bacterium OttesenSCG-928-A17]
MNNKSESSEAIWMNWAKELQFLAQAGIAYSTNHFDIERFERVREISAEMLAHKTGFSTEYVKSVFCNETGFQTPKLDTRAAIFQDDKILLVQESDKRWALPGGWVDAMETVRSNTIKEVKEEAGLDVLPVRLIALHDRNKQNTLFYVHNICKVFVLCEKLGGEFKSNSETLDSGFFELNKLPQLAEEKTTEAQIRMCFEAYENPDWQVIFD